MGKSFIDYCGIKELVEGVILYLIIFYLTKLYRGYIIMFFPIAAAIILIKFLSMKINGVTGGVLGAVCELNQTLFIMISYIILNYGGNL